METYQLVGMKTVVDRRQNLIGAAIDLIRQRGFAGTSVDLICREAGVTKGAFFHHFSDKEQICEVAMQGWCDRWEEAMVALQQDEDRDALDRLDDLFDLMLASYMRPETWQGGCLVGTVAQELSPSNPRLGRLCASHLETWLKLTTPLLERAKEQYVAQVDFHPRDVALHMMTIVQGSLLVAKTLQDPQVIRNSVLHSRTYVNSLFSPTRMETQQL